jgi:hypothetical protein
MEALARLRIIAVAFPKRYPRSDFRSVGRVQVRLKLPDGTLANPEVPNKTKLMEEVARLIPTLEGRKARIAQAEVMRKRIEEVRAKGPRAGKLSKKDAKKQAKEQKAAAAAAISSVRRE